jgi:hypothetical protein
MIFLPKVASDCWAKFGPGISQYVFIFPNKRAGGWFLNELSAVVNEPILAPDCLSIEEFIERNSGLKIAEPLQQLLILFQVYRKYQPGEEFEKFYNWGNLILTDFNDIDKYMVNAERLFRNLSAIKELEASDLPEPLQQEFWETVHDEIPGLLHHRFIELWEVYRQVYYDLKAELSAKGMAYAGMCYREAAERSMRGELAVDAPHYIFVGFNALSKAEETIVATLLNAGKAAIYWDADEYYLDNPREEAGYFIRRAMENLPAHDRLPASKSLETAQKNIHIIGVPLQVGQAKAFGVEMRQFLKPDEHNTTAIVLPDENLLLPILHALPEDTQHLNITAGYPLQHTAVYAFLEAVLSLQHNYHPADLSFYYKDVLLILSHPFIQCRNHEAIAAIIKNIEQYNRVFIRVSELQLEECPLTRIIFRQITDANTLANYFREIICDIKAHSKLPGNDPVFFSEFERILSYLQSVVANGITDINTNTWVRLYREAVRNAKIPLTEQSENGLQIMGLLETRCLDFDKVFILSVNEGVLPANKKGHSYIPFDLRKAFNLPTADEQDSLYAYYFYRLIQGAKDIYLFYNAETGTKGEEKSRYIRQIEQYLAKANADIQLQYRYYTLPIITREAQPIVIQKDEKFFEEFINRSDKNGISPSLITSYYVCPLQFLFNYTIRLRPLEEVTEEWEASDFGQFFHSLMEEIYKDKIGQLITEDFILEKMQMLDRILRQVFSTYERARTGATQDRNSLMVETLKILAEKALEADLEYAPFTLVALEAENKAELEIDNYDYPKVTLLGKIDRIDLKEGQYRIVDYKTGFVDKLSYNYDELSEGNLLNKENKEAFQTLFYSYLFLRNNDQDSITPTLLPLKKVVDGYKEVNVGKAFDRSEMQKFEIRLKEVIQNILNKEEPIRQTADTMTCRYCDYRHFCLR